FRCSAALLPSCVLSSRGDYRRIRAIYCWRSLLLFHSFFPALAESGRFSVTQLAGMGFPSFTHPSEWICSVSACWPQPARFPSIEKKRRPIQSAQTTTGLRPVVSDLNRSANKDDR